MKQRDTASRNPLKACVVLTLSFAFLAAALAGCRKESDYGKVTSSFLSYWQKGQYESAYDLLTPSLRNTKELSEFKAEAEMMTICSFKALHEKRNQGLVYMRYSVDASWKEKENVPDPSALDFIVLKTGEGWRIGAFEEVLKAEEKKDFRDITLLLRDENRIKIAFKDEAGKVLEIRELTLPPEETVQYRQSPAEKLTACRENLKKLSMALEMYGADFKGSYPPHLSMLTPHYLECLPSCPAGGSYRYQKEGKLRTFTIQCCRDAHSEAGISGNFPAYLPVQGVIEK